jgi:AraC-like DNA-binding protein
MDACPEEDWPVERLAEISCVSKAHFARSFKAAFGTPPHRYLLSRRIERANALLRDTDKPITEIALETGWSSIGTFGRTFREIAGDKPQAKRRALISTSVPHQIPICVQRAVDRPQLKSAVLEKRRAGASDENPLSKTNYPMRYQDE